MIPTKISVLQKQQLLKVDYELGQSYEISITSLRAHSPSADRAPSKTSAVEQKPLTIEQLEPVGHYGVKFIFSDGHDTGIYRWDYLRAILE